MNYKIKINDFEGPLDLLLHLIKQSDIDIYDLKIEEITRQYLDYIRAMENLNLSIATEYLVMSAELIEMKSRVLLPKTKVADEDEYVEDPKEALIKRLLEYQKYKEVTTEFKKLEDERQAIYTKLPENLNEYVEDTPVNLESDLSVSDLLNAFEKFMDRKKQMEPLNTTVTTKELSVRDCSDSIKAKLKKYKHLQFEELFENYSKNYVVVTFLSILELARKHEIIIKQSDNFDIIYIELKEGE